ncbi:MAG TPA: diguanylate cyclase [Acidimicrobiales bacterium]|nr:diguanylate cyclase [Acidimicrobiales bacterium]
MAKRSLGIASRFAIVVVVLIPSLGSVAWVGFHGVQSGRNTANSLYLDHIVNVRNASTLALALQEADLDGLQLLGSSVPARRDRIIADLLSRVSPQLDSSLISVDAESADDPLERPRTAAIDAGWSRFQQLLASGAFAGTNTTTGEHVTDSQLVAVLGPASAAAASIMGTEEQQANQAHTQALAVYWSSVRWMLFTVIIALLAGAAVVAWLVRSVLPRTLAYSAFAAEVTQGDYTKRLDPTGNDELSDLGRTLDDLARSRQAEDLYDRHRFEFTDTLQAAETEQEAHDLVKRHLERSVRQSRVTVLNRNNSADRLQAVTSVTPGSQLALGLDAAKPRSCLAVRMARPHDGTYGDEALLSCPVCSQCPGRTTCTPLLVGGQVIGSILAEYEQPLTDLEGRTIREVVIQAAPVLGNLRNLAIAELRAATDSLTGLPNKRAVEDTAKRMVAQSLRSGLPLTALMCDLDHFKSINDRFGHIRGDEVLAAVGAVFDDTLRAGDFAGRYGGEEFLVLLPASDADKGLLVAERIRAGVAALRVATVDQAVTISIGVAVTPDHATDTETLLRAADRALYAAKNGGRDRIEVLSPRPNSPDLSQARQDPSDPVAAGSTNGSSP